MDNEIVTKNYSFIVEWQDEINRLTKFFILNYFAGYEQIEMTRKVFLRRSKHETISLNDLIPGNTIKVFSRNLLIKDYANNTTRDYFINRRSIIFLSPRKKFEDLIDVLESYENRMQNMKISLLSKDNLTFLNEKILQLDQNSKKLESIAIENTVIIIEFIGLISKDYLDSKFQDSYSLVRYFDQKDYSILSSYIFDSNQLKSKLSVDLSKDDFNSDDNCLLIVKPDIIKNKRVGVSLKFLRQKLNNLNLDISGGRTFVLNEVDAREFLEIYDGVIDDFEKVVESISNNKIIVLEISRKKTDKNSKELPVATIVRNITGPINPDIGKKLKTDSLRSLFGVDRINNGFHCTDLESDAPRDLDYFFNNLERGIAKP